MKIQANYNQNVNNNYFRSAVNNTQYLKSITDTVELNLYNQSSVPSFKGQFLKQVKDFARFQKAKQYAKAVAQNLKNSPEKNIPLRKLSMEAYEGLQYGIKVFKGLSMKDIQYLSENLHVIAVNRGCNNMCSHCYADAKPSNRAMSWEDFRSITDGFKTIRERLCGVPLFGETMTSGDDTVLYRSTELFYDADCMALEMKDKDGNIHDFRDMVNELYSMGRKSVFDTSGWNPTNKKMQKRAEDYVEFFSKPENMDKLNQFNLSFNVFNASYVAAVKALQQGDIERYNTLRQKYVDRIANAIFTFTPIFLKQDKLGVILRSFAPNAKNAEHFNTDAMYGLIEDVLNKLAKLYEEDMNGNQKFVKSEAEIEACIFAIMPQFMTIDTGLNSVGRMQDFMKAFKIEAPMQEHSDSTRIMIEDLEDNGRYHRYLAHKLIDTDGRVYHMDYARFFPTDIQLNLDNKTETPPLANLNREFKVSQEIINRKEHIYY